jgi:hypothetical protein
MAFDIQAWLKELNTDNVLSAEELTALQGAVSKPAVLKKIEEGTLRQSDYSRKMGELQQKERETVALQTSLKEWKATADKQIEASNLTAKQKEQRLAQIEASVKAKASEYGLDIAEIIPPESTPAPVVPQNQDPQSPRFLAREDWEKAQAEMARNYPLLPAALHDLSVKHRKTFGTDLEDTTSLVRKAMESQKPLAQVWEEEFKVADKLKEIQEADVNRRIAEAVAAKENQLRSELQLPAPRPEAGHSPVLTVIKPQEQQKPGGGVAAAVAAFNEGKYRQGNS